MKVPLRARTIAFFLVAAMLPSLAIGIVATVQRLEYEKWRTKENLLHQAHTVAVQTEQLLQRAISSLELAAGLDPLHDFASEARVDPGLRGLPADVDVDKRDVLEQLRQMKSGTIFESTFLLNGRGDVYMASPYPLQLSLPSSNYAYAEWFQAAIATHQTVVGDPFVSPSTGRPAVILATLVTPDGDEPIGVLAATLRLDELVRVVSNLNATHETHTFVADRYGALLSSGGGFAPGRDMTDHPAVPIVMTGQEGSRQAKYLGEKYLTGYCPIRTGGTDWGVVVEQPLQSALTSAGRLRNWCVAVTLGASALAAALGGLFANSITRPLKRLAEAARHISQGDRATPVEPASEDELGDLTRAFNKMAEDIARYNERIRGRSDELERLNIRLRELDQLKSEFMANVSHELRTPLNAIIGFTDLALNSKKAGLTPETRHFLERVRTNANDLLTLVGRILKLTRVEAGTLQTMLSTFNLPVFALQCLNEVRGKATSKGIRLRCEVPDNFPELHTDQTLLREIIMNLLYNAVEFTDEGEVEFLAELEVESIGSPPEAVTRELAVLTVLDTGIGIAPEKIPTVFEAFRQVDGSLAREHGGMGLGLSIAKRLTELLRGQISVESKLGEGATFRVKIPVDLARWPA